jgi:ATP-dependent DNA helicase RecG
LRKPHESKPCNPIIANVFYRAGIIERWGTGTLNIIDWCRNNGNPAPTWSEQAGSVFVTFSPIKEAGTSLGAEVNGRQRTGEVTREVTGEATGEATEQVTEQATGQVEAHDEAHDLSETEWAILKACRSAPQGVSDLLIVLGYKTRTGNFKKAMLRLEESLSLLEKTLPDSPRSKNQKYRLTAKGKKVVTTRDS